MIMKKWTKLYVPNQIKHSKEQSVYKLLQRTSHERHGGNSTFFFQQIDHANNENSKIPHHRSLMGEFTSEFSLPTY